MLFICLFIYFALCFPPFFSYCFSLLMLPYFFLSQLFFKQPFCRKAFCCSYQIPALSTLFSDPYPSILTVRSSELKMVVWSSSEMLLPVYTASHTLRLTCMCGWYLHLSLGVQDFLVLKISLVFGVLCYSVLWLNCDRSICRLLGLLMILMPLI